MIQKFVDCFMRNEGELKKFFSEKHVESYKEIVEAVVKVLTDDNYATPDPKRIHEIDDGSYQGKLVYVIPKTGYQPSVYWYVMVGYGSCSTCDTLDSIRGDFYDKNKPTEQQVKDYMSLALHIVQKIKRME